jgi:hypothetical protein
MQQTGMRRDFKKFKCPGRICDYKTGPFDSKFCVAKPTSQRERGILINNINNKNMNI